MSKYKKKIAEESVSVRRRLEMLEKIENSYSQMQKRNFLKLFESAVKRLDSKIDRLKEALEKSDPTITKHL